MLGDEAQAFLAGVACRKAAGPGIEGLGAALEHVTKVITPELRAARHLLGHAEFYAYFDLGFRSGQEVTG